MGALWTFLRLCGIAVGIATLLRLATIGFNVEFNDVFRGFLDQVRNIVELGFLLDPVEKLLHTFLEWVRGLGLSLPDLQPHWKQVLTLVWLLLAALTRNISDKAIVPLAWAFVCALIGAVAAGMQPLASLAVVAWALVGCLLCFAGLAVADGEFEGLRTVGSALVFCVGIGFFSTGPMKEFLGFRTDSPAVLFVVILVAFTGVGMFALGLLSHGTSRERLTNPFTAIGLDIIAVMGGALGIGYFMLK